MKPFIKASKSTQISAPRVFFHDLATAMTNGVQSVTGLLLNAFSWDTLSEKTVP